jgi:hypothetical protein
MTAGWSRIGGRPAVLVFASIILVQSALEQLAEFGLVGGDVERFVGFDDGEVIDAGVYFVLHETEGFAEAAFDEVAFDGVSAAAADGDPEFGGVVVVASHGEEHEGVGDAFFAGLVEEVEAAVAAEALGALEFVAGFGGR